MEKRHIDEARRILAPQQLNDAAILRRKRRLALLQLSQVVGGACLGFALSGLPDIVSGAPMVPLSMIFYLIATAVGVALVLLPFTVWLRD